MEGYIYIDKISDLKNLEFRDKRGRPYKILQLMLR